MSSQPNASVMIVDDDAVVTETIRTFLQLETDYDVHTFDAPAKALKALEHTHVDLVISDFLMPDMNGLEFLLEVKRHHPDIVRVLLTGYADKENAIRAINQVELFQYLEKPWENEQLVLVIKNGLRQRALSTQLRNKIRQLDRVEVDRDQISRERDDLRQQLSLARRVQETMLPDGMPGRDRFRFAMLYEPALALGGDFYDAVEDPDGGVTLLVADATGHGAQAALSTALIKSAFAEHARAKDPSEVLRLMNLTLHRVLPSELFVAACVARLSSDAATVDVANAGGPHPLLLRNGNGDIDVLAANGLPLGAVDEEAYVASDIIAETLGEGDRLIMCTDGLTEVENSDGKEFGETALCPRIREWSGSDLEHLCEWIRDGAHEFAANGHQWDDVTIVGVERRA